MIFLFSYGICNFSHARSLKNKFYIGIIFLFALAIKSANSQSPEISSFFPEIQIAQSNGPAPGYFFLASKGLTAEGAQQYLAIVDNTGLPVFFRLMPKPSGSFRTFSDGRMAYMQGVPRMLYFMNEFLEVTDTFNTIGYKLDAHDYAVDNKGNVVLMAKENRPVDMSAVVEGGDPNATVIDLIIQEFDKDHNMLLSWNSADHFEITDANENSPYVDFTEQEVDYVHPNSVAIDSDTSILVSSRHMDEITKIHRKSGEIIWRLGGKKNDFTFLNDTIGFSHQHSVSRLENGNILLFDNGNLHDSLFSSAVEYSLDEENFTATLVIRYRRNPDTYSNHGACTQRVFNGNTIIGWGTYWPSATEFHADGSPAIELDFTKHSFSPRIEKFPWKTKVFETSVDSIDFGMWDGTNYIEQTIALRNNLDTSIFITSDSSRSGYFKVSTQLPIEIPGNGETNITIRFDPSNATLGYLTDVISLNSDSDEQRVARQIVVSGQKEDLVAPVASITPDTSNVPLDAIIHLKFSKPVRKKDGTELKYDNVDALLIVRKENELGEDLVFNANINSTKDHIEVQLKEFLDPGQTYYVSFIDEFEDYSGNKLPVTSVTFTTWPPLSLNENSIQTPVLIFPNPSSGFLTVETDSAKIKSLEIYSASGILILKKENIWDSRTFVNLSDKPAGLYLVVLRSDDHKIIHSQKVFIGKY